MDINEARTKFDAGRQAFTEARYTAALAFFSELSSHFPDRASVVDGLLASLIKLGRFSEAAKCLDAFHVAGGLLADNPDIALKAAICARCVGDFQGARDYLQVCESVSPDALGNDFSFSLDIEHIELLRASGDFQAAFARMDALSCQLFSGEPAVRLELQRANLMLESGEPVLAIEILRGLQSKPPIAKLVLASALRQLHRFAEAIDVLDEVRRTSAEGDTDHARATGELLLTLGDAGLKGRQRELILSLEDELVRSVVVQCGASVFLALREFGVWAVDDYYESLVTHFQKIIPLPFS